jgi:hypothetical protein
MDASGDAPPKRAVDPARPTGMFVRFIFGVFAWCMAGVVAIYGVRLYQDVPMHPSFAPLMGAVFAAVLSFTLVMTLKIVDGPINLRFGDNYALEGATGPIALWCVCFLSVCFGLYLLGLLDVAKAPPAPYVSCSAGDAIGKHCASQSVAQVSKPAASSAAP